jgi:hypothetical protein
MAASPGACARASLAATCARMEMDAGGLCDVAESRLASAGYDAAGLVERAQAAARAVRAGKGAWERDGTLLRDPAVHVPLLTIFQKIAAQP